MLKQRFGAPRASSRQARPAKSVHHHAPRTVSTRAQNQSQTVATAGTAAPVLDMQAKMDFLREDLQHLFDDQGIDASQYEDVVDFRDPITKYTSLSGYLFNIAFLRRAFNPKFELHDMRQTSDTAITTRWTMSMEFTPASLLPTKKFWNPTILFTGTSTYIFNPASGKIVTHIDTWDSIKNQDFFSVEAFMDFNRQLLAFYATPSLETPDFTVLRRASDYEVRRYAPFTVAQTAMDDAAQLNPQVLQAGQVSVNPAGPGMRAFNVLAKYIFGDNAQRTKMAMTTPVFSDTRGNMQFVVGASAVKAMPGGLPAPNSPSVKVTQAPGGLFAVRKFNGVANEQSSSQEAAALRSSLQRDGLGPRDDGSGGKGYTLARYNDPSTPGMFRRNEVLIELEEFDMWR